MEYQDLSATLSYLSPADREMIERAYRLALRAHEGQKRASGEPYIQHCLAVAKILADLHLPGAAIAAGLLHDVVEDTPVSLEMIRKEFGDEVLALVDGVTKLTQLPRVTRDDGRGQPVDEETRRKALDVETLRKIFFAMGDDVRVVVIKLADRLHNLRTLNHLPPDRRKAIAQETLELFAPLANRLGIWQMKWELEDLAFHYVNSSKYKEIASKLEERRSDRETMMKTIVENLRAELTRAGVKAEVTGRPKHIYSIYRKMVRKGVPFESVHDVRAVRIIVKDIPACYVALGVIHNLWVPLPKEFDDYIASPKDNFYQSLHTAVVYEDGKTLEVQIRTPEMHVSAELGIAAHWRYKEEGTKRDESFERRVLWLRGLMDWRQEVPDAGDFLDGMKTDVFEDRVFAFTPKGDVFDMPAGSTPIDFAYHVHTEIGHHCRGARVNGKMVSLDHRLRTGDQVEIVTTRSGGPSRDWMNPHLGLVKSQRALSKIRQWFKHQDLEQKIATGRDILLRELHRLGIEEEITLESLAKQAGFPAVNDFLAAIGSGDVSPSRLVSKFLETERPGEELVPDSSAAASATTGEVNVTGLRGMLTNLARCCKPVPGDPIVGYITRGQGATIHRSDCKNILRIPDKERLVRVSWGRVLRTYPVEIRISAFDREGLLRDVSSVVTEDHISMRKVNVSTKAHEATIDMLMEVTDLTQLSRVLSRIEALPNVFEARRIRP
ncbi:MAG: bifunctional (p)ppGpp synthetase/guanosine-3',5'-bis(diphosphate) 3'-pyrophosphohydrolase [Anaerolineales bacterium]|nr:bifunctional (p)ppGpp synthetase/guanosine-3',5'-bis(diphosphate) 3'-pyrophosphohydrolase [Anaerolineales bacterium]